MSGIMERRSSERISVNIDAICDYKGLPYFVVITNCSETGMCISTRIGAPPLNGKINIVIPSKEEIIKVSAEMRWFETTIEYHYELGLELLNPPGKYLDLLKINP